MDEIDVKLFDWRLASLHPVTGRPTRSCRSNLVHSGPKSWHNLANLSILDHSGWILAGDLFFLEERYSTNGLGPYRNPLWKWMGTIIWGDDQILNQRAPKLLAEVWSLYGIPYLWGQGGRTRCSKKIRTKSWVKRQKKNKHRNTKT